MDEKFEPENWNQFSISFPRAHTHYFEDIYAICITNLSSIIRLMKPSCPTAFSILFHFRCGPDLPAVASAAGTRAIAASTGPGPGARSRTGAGPEMKNKQVAVSPLPLRQYSLKIGRVPSPAATASFAEAVAIIGIVATIPTLVTPVIRVKLPSAGAPTAFPGKTC